MAEKKGYNPNKLKYNMEYKKKFMKRIPLDVQKDEYDQIKAAADHAGMSVNGFIRKTLQAAIAAFKRG